MHRPLGAGRSMHRSMHWPDDAAPRRRGCLLRLGPGALLLLAAGQARHHEGCRVGLPGLPPRQRSLSTRRCDGRGAEGPAAAHPPRAGGEPTSSPPRPPAERFSVAPMMEYTDAHFRTLLRLLTRHAALYTEMVASAAVEHSGDDARWFDHGGHQGGNKRHNPEFLGFRKQTMAFERIMGGELFLFTCRLTT